MESCNDEPEEQHIAFLQEAMTNSGTNIGQHATITISFDASPENLTASSGTLSVSGTKVTINGPFPPGPLTLILKWEDGETTLNYIVRPPGIGDEITTATGTTMVFIPAGEFEMGSNAADQRIGSMKHPYTLSMSMPFTWTNTKLQTRIFRNSC